MIQEEAKVTPNIVAGTLQLNCLPMYVLFDYGATHSFVTNKLVGKLGKNPCRAKKGFTISSWWCLLMIFWFTLSCIWSMSSI